MTVAIVLLLCSFRRDSGKCFLVPTVFLPRKFEKFRYTGEIPRLHRWNSVAWLNHESPSEIHVMNLWILHYSLIRPNHRFHQSTMTIKPKINENELVSELLWGHFLWKMLLEWEYCGNTNTADGSKNPRSGKTVGHRAYLLHFQVIQTWLQLDFRLLLCALNSFAIEVINYRAKVRWAQPRALPLSELIVYMYIVLCTVFRNGRPQNNLHLQCLATTLLKRPHSMQWDNNQELG